jgi:alpha-tubulin suppressor-like RCC1 family protein
LIDSLQGIKIVGSSAGHRHSLLLDENGSVYSFGAGNAGGLGHGDTESQMYPMRIAEFENINVRIMQISAGVDMSMAVSTTGDVYAWGKTEGGRLGLGLSNNEVTLPRRVYVANRDGSPVKAVDVECGYVHSLIVGLDGTLHMCGGVGIEGEADGQKEDEEMVSTAGRPRQVADFNIWHRVPEPKEHVKKEKWKKLNKYEVKGRAKAMTDT